jgi:hypothetical protein
VLLGLEGEGIDVDTSDRDVGVVLVRLDKVEVRAESLNESVVAVKLELGTDSGVSASIDRAETSVVSVVSSSGEGTEVSGGKVAGIGTRAGRVAEAKRSHLTVSGTEDTIVHVATDTAETRGVLHNIAGAEASVVAEESGILGINITETNEGEYISVTINISEDKLRRISDTSGAETSISIVVVSVVVPLVETSLDDVISLHNPDELLARVVEIELHLNVGIDSGFVTSELKLINEVLVRSLGESASLVSVEVDVVDEESCVLKGRNAESIVSSSGTGTASGGDRGRDVALTLGSELKVELDLVVLKSNKRKSKTRVSAEPELEWDVKGSGISAGKTGTGEGNSVTNHVVITRLETSRDGELVPDGEPITIVLVDSLTTDLNLDLLDKHVANIVDPAEEVGRNSGFDRGESHLKVDSVDKVTVSRNSAGNSLTEVSSTVEGLLDRLHREVSVSAVDNLEEGNLRITGKIDILCAIGN